MTTTTTATARQTETKAETIKINAFCDTCQNEDYATEKVLTACGWELSPSYQFCPNCAIG